ncbi:MAG: hypothetical protein HY558_06395 [Euryarchaeota archaeon]|nr:hypothetical protein [Euryarchaeota archaeon]
MDDLGEPLVAAALLTKPRDLRTKLLFLGMLGAAFLSFVVMTAVLSAVLEGLTEAVGG